MSLFGPVLKAEKSLCVSTTPYSSPAKEAAVPSPAGPDAKVGVEAQSAAVQVNRAVLAAPEPSAEARPEPSSNCQAPARPTGAT